MDHQIMVEKFSKSFEIDGYIIKNTVVVDEYNNDLLISHW